MKLTQEQIDSFWKEGYLAAGAVFRGEELDTLRQEYDRLFEEAQVSGRLRNLSDDGKATMADGKQQMLQIMNVFLRSPTFLRLIYDARLLDLVEDLIGPNIMVYHDQALFKPAYHGGPVLWHQDNGYWECRPATLVSCWITLDDVVRENGAMQVIPGSHLEPVWHQPSASTSALREIEPSVDTARAKVVELPAGGLMLHHCQTLHYTQPNETGRQRRAYAIHYMQPGTEGKAKETRKRFTVSLDRPMVRACV